MQFIIPSVEMGEDREDRIMARSGNLVGVTKSRAVWRFGFLPDSDLAKAFGVHINEFFWILAEKDGKVLASHTGFGKDLPERFHEVIEGKI